MTYKLISTSLLVIIAVALLVNLAFKVKVSGSGDSAAGRYASKGCCANSGGGCAANKTKGE